MGAEAWLRRLLLLLVAAVAAASTAHNTMAESTTTMRGASVAAAAGGAGMSPLSLPTLMAGVEGLSPPCQKGAFCVFCWHGVLGGMTTHGWGGRGGEWWCMSLIPSVPN